MQMDDTDWQGGHDLRFYPVFSGKEGDGLRPPK